MLKKLHVNISFIDDLSQMPMHAKFLKEILSKKRKIDKHETIALSEECSVMVPKKDPAKLKDPGSFFILCLIEDVSIHRLYVTLVQV